jgi:hypothetical protein
MELMQFNTQNHETSTNTVSIFAHVCALGSQEQYFIYIYITEEYVSILLSTYKHTIINVNKEIYIYIYIHIYTYTHIYM